MNDITLKISIDGEEAQTSIIKVEGLVDELTSKVDAVGSKNPFREATVGAKALGDGIKAAGNSAVQAAPSFGQAKAGLMNLGYVVQDSSMFMVDFRMGMMSVANNIPGVAQGFMSLSAAAKETGVTFGTALKSALTGPTGVLLAINAVMLAVTVLPKIFDSGTESIKRQRGEVNRLAKEYDNLSTAMLNNKLLDIQSEMLKIKQNPSTQGFWSGVGQALQVTWDVMNMSKSDRENRDVVQKSYEKAAINNDEYRNLENQYNAIKGLLDKKNKLVQSFKSGVAPKDLQGIGDLKRTLNVELEHAGTQKERDELIKTLANLSNIEDNYRGKDLEKVVVHTGKKGKISKDANDQLKIQQSALWDELTKSSLTGEKLELFNLSLWYKEKAGIAKGDTKLLEALNADYLAKQLSIQESYLHKELQALAHKQAEEKKLLDKFGKETNDKELVGRQKELFDLKEWYLKWADTVSGSYEMTAKLMISYKEKEKQINGKYDKLAKQEMIEKQKQDIERWKESNQTTIAGFDAVGAATRTMWTTFIVGSRQAKDGWDAVWLSFRNTALNRLFEIASNAIWDELYAKLAGTAAGASAGGNGSGSSWGWVTDILAFLPMLFAGGGIVTSPTMGIVGEAGPEAVIPLQQLPNILNRNYNNFDNSSIISKLDNVAKRFEEKQFTIDMQKMRTVNRRLDSIENRLRS